MATKRATNKKNVNRVQKEDSLYSQTIQKNYKKIVVENPNQNKMF